MIDISPKQALEIAQGAARLGRIWLSVHARQRCVERSVSPRDIESAILAAERAEWDSEHASWKIVGTTHADSELLAVAVGINGSIVTIVTVFEGPDD